jgi:hypothetical protein
MIRRYRLLWMAAATLAGCGTIVHGSNQTIALATSPPGAQCGVYRHGELIDKVAATPGSVAVTRERQELTVLCVKPGYHSATAFLPSGDSTDRVADIGNMALGAGPGWAVDSMTNASLQYQEPATLTLQRGGGDAAVLPPGLRLSDGRW